MKEYTVGLVVPVLSNFEGFTRLMHSLDSVVQVYVIENYDNGNRGVAWAWNEGIRRAKIDNHNAVVISNDDIEFEPRAFDTLVAELENRDLDVASMVNTRDFPEPGSGSEHEVDYACFALRPASFVDKFGWFDENFFPAYFEDNDMSRRIDLAGGLQRKILSARMYHKGSQTQFARGEGDDERVVSHDRFRANRAYYFSKWGGAPGDERFDAPHGGATGKTYKEW